MSENFDGALARIAGSAAEAAGQPGAAAARKRGRQRTVRRRAAASALSLALIGGGAGIAAASIHPGGPKPMVAASGTPSTSSSPAPTSTPSTAPTTPAPGGTTSTATGIAPNPGQYVAGAWLSAGQEPFGTTVNWQASTDLEGSRIGAEVFEITDPASPAYQSDVACQAADFPGTQAAAQYQMFDGPGNENTVRGNSSLGGSTIAANAYQNIFFYPNATSADTGWGALLSDFSQCAQHETGTDPTTGEHITGETRRTTSQSDAECWSNLMLVTADPGASSIEHGCFIRHGDLIEVVGVSVNADSSFSTVDFGAGDAGTLQAMRQTLSVYQG
jgi:hypothetical protein